MKNTFEKRLLSLVLCLVLALSMFALTGCSGSASGTATQTQTAAQTDGVTELGEGDTDFELSVVDADGNETQFLIHTDAQTVGDALSELGLIEGEESSYGLYVKTVNGITADYDTDGTYWAFYIDGEYASTGVDSTDITAGSVYSLKVEK